LCPNVEWKKVVRRKKNFREGTALFIGRYSCPGNHTNTETETERPIRVGSF
jgi:hypothetical protein